MPHFVNLPSLRTASFVLAAFAFGCQNDSANAQQASVRRNPEQQNTFVDAVGDGVADDTDAIQSAVDEGRGDLRFAKGTYRLTRTIEIPLDRAGFTSIHGGGVARFVMQGAGPAFRFIGTHEGTAAPRSFEPDVWARQRAPMVVGIEIVGAHPEACGIEASGTMQLTIDRLVVREALHAVHLTKRNRNVTLSQCHLYQNRGIGVFLDRLNLHQIDIANCHISYNAGGGVVAKQSELRNLQIGTCDIEGNMGDEASDATANVWLDSTDSSIAEVAIVGCTIQHTHDAPDSANIRINGQSSKRPFTDELRHGNVTIANNVLSDVQVNIDIENVRGLSITGNTLWKGYEANLVLNGCSQVTVASNVLDRNPRYHYGDGSDAKLGTIITDCHDCTFTGNLHHGVVDRGAAVVLRRCRRINMTGSNILDYGRSGLFLDEVQDSIISGCIIRDDREEAEGKAIRTRSVTGSMLVNNLLGDG